MKKEDIFSPVRDSICPAPTVLKTNTIQEVISMLKKNSKKYESVDYIYVTENHNLIGVFSIKELFRLPPSTKVEKVMLTKVISASPKSEGEHVAQLSISHGIKSIPIVESKRFLGVIPPSKVSKLINHSLRKDSFHFAGIHKSHLDYENTMDIPVMDSVIHRTPWLISGLIGILAIAAFIGMFENTLEENIIIAFFIPVIVYICGALCTQIETILVRDLTVLGKEMKIHKYVFKQGTISIIIALMISALLFLTISSFWQERTIASVISLAAFLSLTLTTLTSFGIILGIKKLGGDPALGGGPFGTVISDSLAIIIYLLVANTFL